MKATTIVLILDMITVYTTELGIWAPQNPCIRVGIGPSDTWAYPCRCYMLTLLHPSTKLELSYTIKRSMIKFGELNHLTHIKIFKWQPAQMPFWTFSHAYVEKVATCVSASSTNHRLNRPKRKGLSRIIPPSPFQRLDRIFESLHQSWIGEWPTHATYLHKFHILVQDPHTIMVAPLLNYCLYYEAQINAPPNSTGLYFFCFFVFFFLKKKNSARLNIYTSVQT
jgi:hypothetical protein